jgi:peptidoglycan/LPS O-acetylase OafA/YrhL
MHIAWLPKQENTHWHFPIFDALRGIAAFLVLCYHFWTFFPFEGGVSFPFSGGHLGVDLFFVISGFVIFLSLLRSSSLLSFFSKRFWRIFPLAAFFVLTVFCMKAVLDGGISGELLRNGVAHILFIQSLFPETYHGLHPVMWTLTVEVLFYLSLPLLLYLGRKRLSHFLGIIGCLTLMSWIFRAWIYQFFGEWDIHERVFYSEQFWGRFDQFTLGIGLALLWIFREKWIPKVSEAVFLFSQWGGLGALLFIYFFFAYIGSDFRDSLFLQVFLHFLVTLALSIFLMGILFFPRNTNKGASPRMEGAAYKAAPDKKRTPLAPLIRGEYFIFLGHISYSLYLWHFPIQSFWKKAVEILPFSFPIVVSFICSTSITILVSYFSWRWIEVKIPKLIKKWKA